MLPQSFQDAIDQLNTLPGIGPRTAERLAYHLLQLPENQREEFANALLHAADDIQRCGVCYGVFGSDPCSICNDAHRATEQLCVVGETRDIIAIEKTGEYHGRYHVLGGLLNPIEGVHAGHLTVQQLVTRCADDDPKIDEVIIATDPNVEGEATAQHIRKVLERSDIHVSRLALGLPMGGTVEYADEISLANALKGRRTL